MANEPAIKSIVRGVVKEELVPVNEHFKKIEESLFQMERHMDKFEQQLIAEFAKFRSEMHTLISPLFGELKKFNEEQTIHAGQHQEMYQKVENLEKIHPHHTHQIATA